MFSVEKCRVILEEDNIVIQLSRYFKYQFLTLRDSIFSIFLITFLIKLLQYFYRFIFSISLTCVFIVNVIILVQ